MNATTSLSRFVPRNAPRAARTRPTLIASWSRPTPDAGPGANLDEILSIFEV